MPDQIAVIGGAGGIGSKIVSKYASAGSHVIMGDIAKDKGERIAEDTKGNVTFIYVDVTDGESIKSFANTVSEQFGWVNHVVSLAGATIEGEFDGFEELTFEIIDWSVNLNLTSHIYLTRVLLPLIVKSPRTNKTITYVSSINAVMSFGQPAYSSAKAGLLGLTRSLCRELGEKQIRVNSVLPGSVDTPLTRGEPSDLGKLREGTVLNRIATDKEIADVVYSVTELMTCVTGQAIIADCGQTVKGVM